MRKIANKIFRDNLETRLTNKFRMVYPHFEFQHRALRLPVYPKIVLYSNVPTIDRYVQQCLPGFKVVTPQPSELSDELLTKQIVIDIINPKAITQVHRGIIIKGFPFNTAQALVLDQYFKGVNLALFVKAKDEAPNAPSLLEYYRQRGALVELDYKDQLTAQQVQSIQRKLLQSLKSSD